MNQEIEKQHINEEIERLMGSEKNFLGEIIEELNDGSSSSASSDNKKGSLEWATPKNRSL